MAVVRNKDGSITVGIIKGKKPSASEKAEQAKKKEQDEPRDGK